MNQKLQDKLYNHPTYVNTDAIWKNLKKKRKKKRFFIFLLFAVIAGILFSILFKEYNTNYASISIAHSSDTLAQNIAKDLNHTDTKHLKDINTTTQISATSPTSNNTLSTNAQASFQIEKSKSINSSITKSLGEQYENTILNSSEKTVKFENKLSESLNNIVPYSNKSNPAFSVQHHIGFQKSALENKTIASLSDLDKLHSYLVAPKKSLIKFDIADNEKTPMHKSRGKFGLLLDVGTVFHDSSFDTYYENLPGVNLSLLFSKQLSSKLLVGIGANYMQFREHFSTVHNYTQETEIDAVTSEIYYQDGTVEYITSKVAVVDNYKRAISIVNKKNRIDLCFAAHYELINLKRFSFFIKGQFNYNVLTWNKGMEVNENWNGIYDIGSDPLNVISAKNKINFRYGAGLSYYFDERMDFGLTFQKFESVNPFYVDSTYKYTGYLLGVYIGYRL